jgi:hypothetical protein
VRLYKPGKSNNWTARFPNVTRPIRRSTVVPGKFAVFARNPVNALNNVVFPAFGFPTNAKHTVEPGPDLLFFASRIFR